MAINSMVFDRWIIVEKYVLNLSSRKGEKKIVSAFNCDATC